jgi:uncharacterized membrane protein
MDNLIVIGKHIVNVNEIKYVRSNTGSIHIKRRTNNNVDTLYISAAEYQEFRKRLEKYHENLQRKNEILELRRENERLKLQLSLMPGGAEYMAAQQRFENNVSNIGEKRTPE